MRILLANAYSALNAGDGLLVRLALGLLEEAFPQQPLEIVLSASHPESFTGLSRTTTTTHPLRARRPAAAALCGLGAFAVPGTARWALSSTFNEALSRCDLVVSVGGGYLRQPSLRGGVASVAVHGAQIRAIAASGKPWVLLPQSIGPLVGRTGALLRESLAAASAVWVRDDRSFVEVGPQANVLRAPDMALLSLAGGLPSPVTGDGTVGVVVRPLERPRNYEAQVRRILDLLPRSRGLVQSSHSGNDDRPFTEGLGLRTDTSLRDALAEGLDARPSAVVSVRLHGALESILAGVPAVHLGYERKAWGAYGDVGLEQYLHPARDFDPVVVSQQLLQLTEDPSAFWSSLALASERLASAREAVVTSVRTAVGVRP